VAGASQVGAALGTVGVVAGVVAGVFAVLAVASKKLSDTLSLQVEKLEGYSPDVSAATAETELRRERAMFDRAERIGPDLAEFERSRGKMEERLEKLLTEILNWAIGMWQVLEPFVSKMVSILEAILAGIGVLIELAKQIIDTLDTFDITGIKGSFDEISKAADRFRKEVIEVFRGEADDDDFLTDPFLEEFLRSADPLRGPEGDGRRRAPPRPGEGGR